MIEPSRVVTRSFAIPYGTSVRGVPEKPEAVAEHENKVET